MNSENPDKKKILEQVDKFVGCKILVIGDVMLDEYAIGEVERLSPEAPVPILLVKNEKHVLGGAANVAHNVATLGGKVVLFGLTSNDETKKRLVHELDKSSIKYELFDFLSKTICKMRFLSKEHHLLRVDREEKAKLTLDQEEAILKRLANEIKDFNAVIISDYSKGMITQNIAKSIIKIANLNNVAVLVDPKPQNMIFFKDATIITPNEKEARSFVPPYIEDIDEVGKHIVQELNTVLFMTRSEKGISIYQKSKDPIHVGTKAKEVYDVTGAGDTTISAMALCISCKIDFETAANIANHAASVVLAKVGTAVCTLNELKNNILRNGGN